MLGRNWKPPQLNISGLGSFLAAPLTPRTPNGGPAELPDPVQGVLPPPESVMRVNGDSHGAPARRVEDDDGFLDDDFPLPFSAAAAAYRDAYASPDVAAVAAFAPPAQSLIFSPGRSVVSNRDSIISSASIETKDDFLLELLSGQALVEAQDFQILPWETVDQLKSEHKDVVDQISRMTTTLASETKIRDAASSLKRQNTARSASLHPGLERNNSVASIDERVTRSSTRVESLSAELYTLKHREITIRTKLLRHIAAVLAATLRRRDSISNPGSKRSSLHAKKGPPNGSRRQSQAAPSPLRGHAQFDGNHFFANNRSAMTPLPRGSPRLNGVDPSVHAAVQLEVEERTAEAERLKSEISRLSAALATSQSSVQVAERQLSTSRMDVDAQKSALEQMARRSEVKAQGERSALLAALSRHRSSNNVLASCVPTLSATDDAAAVFDTFFQQASAHVQSLTSTRETQAGDLINARADADRLSRRAAEAEAHQQQAQATLRDLWLALPAPSNVDVATAAPATLTSAFSSAALPGSSSGLRISNDTAGFSHEALIERVKSSALTNRALAGRVAREAGDGSSSKQELDRLRVSLKEAQDTAAQAKYQLRDLEARAAAAASQEIASLERLNELQAGFENTRMDKARAERERDNQTEKARQAIAERDGMSKQIDELQSLVEAAKNTTNPLKLANERLEQEIEDLKQQLLDAQDDLDDMKGRESKQRVALLDELNTAQTEISTLRSQLRAEQRRKAA